jgi:hypothetical protein
VIAHWPVSGETMDARRRLLLEPDEREAGAADQVPVPAGHAAAGARLLRLRRCRRHRGDRRRHLQGRGRHTGGPRREGTPPPRSTHESFVLFNTTPTVVSLNNFCPLGFQKKKDSKLSRSVDLESGLSRDAILHRLGCRFRKRLKCWNRTRSVVVNFECGRNGASGHMARTQGI